ncbi:MAG: RecX family transcriptional regulator, partial [Flavobacteriales bacterium]|nr:RecX family transcriptional regulator [Flavobacteriales bacterium]
FVQGKVNLKKWGKQKIRMGLIQHKISKELIDQGLKNIPKEKYDHNLSGLAEKKALTLKEGLSAFEKKGKVLRFLSSKGYSGEDFDRVDFSSLFSS